jgi:hypothetical protein
MAQTEAEILNSLVPVATVENITFESNRLFTYSKGIAVRVVYSISDVVNQDAIGTWFNQQEYEKYFQIRTRLEYDGVVDQDINTTPEIRYTNLGEMIESQNDSNISKFTFEKTYYIDNQPESMNFYVVTSFDISQMEQDYGIDLFNAATRDTQKTEKIEIYKNGQLQYPIQDFRIREEIKKFEFLEQRAEDFKFLEEQVLTKKERDSSFTTDFISDLWITRNAQGEAKFVFIFDIASFFEKRSEYKDIYKRLTSIEKYNLINQMQIPSLKILRKRVEVVQDINGRTVKDFKDERTLEEIVETTKLSGGAALTKVITDTGSIMQINITGVSESPLDDNNLMFVTGTDYDIANVTDGVYSYGVSIEIIDTTRQLLLRKLSRLSESISVMKKILAGSIRPEFYDARTDLYTRPLEEIVSDAGEIREFKSTKDRARDIYRTFIGRPNVGGKGLQRLGFLRDAQLIADETLRKIGDLLRMDKIKSPKELEVIIEVMESLLANAASSIGESNDYYEGRLSPSVTDARITAKKFYTSPEKLFDSNVPKLEGIEYLSNFSTTTSDAARREITSLSRDAGEVGLRVINGAEYTDRVKQEINKYFPAGTTEVSLPVLEGAPGSNNVSLLGPGSEFLSMSAFMDSDRNLSVFTGLGDTAASEAIIRNDVLLNVEGHFPGSPAYVPSGNRPEASYLSRRDATLEHIFKTNTLLNQDIGSTDSSATTANSPDNSIEPIEEQASATLEKQRSFEKFIFDKVSKEERLEGEILDLSGLPPSDRRATAESAPNQVISLMQDGPASMESVFVVTLEFLTKISYLSGFDPDENRLNVSLPRWENLTLDVYSNNADKNLLCKISPSHLPALGIRTANSRTPIYDAFFIIKPAADFELEMGSQFARNLASDAAEQDERDQNALPFANSVDSVKSDLRRRLAEKFRILQEKREELEQLRADILEAEGIIAQLVNNPDNYSRPDLIFFGSVQSSDIQQFMKPEPKFIYTYWDNTLHEFESGMIDRRSSLIPEVSQLEVEVDTLRERLRNLEGSNIVRLDLN